MRKSRFTVEQIAMTLRQGEAGTPVAEIIRKLEISEQTYYRWKKKYGGLGVSELRELKSIRDENRRLKTLVADLSLDKRSSPRSFTVTTSGSPGRFSVLTRRFGGALERPSSSWRGVVRSLWWISRRSKTCRVRITQTSGTARSSSVSSGSFFL